MREGSFFFVRRVTIWQYYGYNLPTLSHTHTQGSRWWQHYWSSQSTRPVLQTAFPITWVNLPFMWYGQEIGCKEPVQVLKTKNAPQKWAQSIWMLLVSQKFPMFLVRIQAYLSFYRTSLYWASLTLCILQIEDKTLRQQKEHDSLYYDTCFTAVVCNPTRTISKVCLYSSAFNPYYPAYLKKRKSTPYPSLTFTFIEGFTSQKNSPVAITVMKRIFWGSIWPFGSLDFFLY